ncbi:hypothetical protein [Oryzifoliimicrobium ureilyticus]
MSISVNPIIRSLRVFEDIRSAVGAAKEFKCRQADKDGRAVTVAL